jgi:hypothetical protein
MPPGHPRDRRDLDRTSREVPRSSSIALRGSRSAERTGRHRRPDFFEQRSSDEHEHDGSHATRTGDGSGLSSSRQWHLATGPRRRNTRLTGEGGCQSRLRKDCHASVLNPANGRSEPGSSSLARVFSMTTRAPLGVTMAQRRQIGYRTLPTSWGAVERNSSSLPSRSTTVTVIDRTLPIKRRSDWPRHVPATRPSHCPPTAEGRAGLTIHT